MKKEHLEVINQVVEKFGHSKQLDMCIEEMSELIQAILKNRRNANTATEYNLVEEYADVTIMMEQLRIIIDNDLYIQSMVEEKINRIKERLL